MNFAFVKSPLFIGGAALIGVVALATRKTASTSSVDAITVYNQAASANVTALASIRAQSIADANRTDIIRRANLLESIGNMFSISQQTSMQKNQSMSGVLTSQIEANSAAQINRDTNSARLTQVQIQDSGLTARTMANNAAQIQLADISSRTTLMADALQAGVQMHQIDVTSQTAQNIATTQASLSADVAKTSSFFAALAAMNAPSKSSSSENVRTAILAASNVLGSFLGGGLSATSASALPALFK